MVLGEQRGPEDVVFCNSYETAERVAEIHREILAGYDVGDAFPAALEAAPFRPTRAIARESCARGPLTYTPMVGGPVRRASIVQSVAYELIPKADGDIEAETCEKQADPQKGRCSSVVVVGNFVPAIIWHERSERIVFVQTQPQIIDPETGQVYGRPE